FGFQTLTPCRILDTRNPSAPITSNTVRNITVQGVCGIPTGAAAAALNLSITQPTSSGYAVLYPSDSSQPPVSAINFSGGTGAIANGARLRLAATTPDLSLVYATYPGATTHAVLDVAGYFKTGAPFKYHPITPCRELDTRFADQGAPAWAGGES